MKGRMYSDGLFHAQIGKEDVDVRGSLASGAGENSNSYSLPLSGGADGKWSRSVMVFQ